MKEGKEVETGQTERTEELHFIQSCRNRFQKAIFQGFLPPETLVKGTQGQENTDPDKAGPLIETVQSICRTRVQAVFLPSLPTSPRPTPATASHILQKIQELSEPTTFCKAIPTTRPVIFSLFSSFKTTLSKQPRKWGLWLDLRLNK